MSKLCLALAISLLVLVVCSNESEVISSEPITEPPESPVISQSPSPSLSLWSEEEAVALAQMLWGEARGVPSDAEKAACVWCVLNRCDAYGKGILEVVSAPYQFAGYSPDNPVDETLKSLCEDVLTRYFDEKAGESDVGRVLPSDYLFFSGDGERNYFRNEYEGGQTWDWSLPSPYES